MQIQVSAPAQTHPHWGKLECCTSSGAVLPAQLHSCMKTSEQAGEKLARRDDACAASAAAHHKVLGRPQQAALCWQPVTACPASLLVVALQGRWDALQEETHAHNGEEVTVLGFVLSPALLLIPRRCNQLVNTHACRLACCNPYAIQQCNTQARHRHMRHMRHMARQLPDGEPRKQESLHTRPAHTQALSTHVRADTPWAERQLSLQLT